MGYSPWDRKELNTTERLSTREGKGRCYVGLIWGGYRKEGGRQVGLERGAGLGYKKPVDHNLYFVLQVLGR